MSGYREEQPSVVVATAATQAEAELVRMTLVAHGIVAQVSPADPAHPSLNFVQGISIAVPSDAEEQARRLLSPA